MANITKRGAAYRIKVSCGYDVAGKQIIKSMTWKPEPGMTERQEEKEVQRQAVLFEDKCRSGQVLSGNIRFSEFVGVWMEKYAKPQLKAKTLDAYEYLLKRILPALGHIRLDKLQPQHLLEFYENLREADLKQTVKYRCKKDLKKLLKDQGQTKPSFAARVGVGVTVLNSITQGKNISRESAEKISRAFDLPLLDVFEPVGFGQLSEKTVLHHHRLISSILQTAVQWQVIPSNPCSRVRAPRVQHKESQYLEEEQVFYMLERLEEEDEAHRGMIYLLLYSGMRRGELCGLEWSDIDFENDVINIRRNSVYISGKGVITNDPKTSSSIRAEKISHDVIELLSEHKHQQKIQRLSVGAGWIESDRVFTQWNGAPIFPDGVSKWFRHFMERIGLSGYSLHSLRHTNASLMIASGVDVRTVAARLGHAQTSTTTNIYAHLIRSADEKASEAIEDMLNLKKSARK